MLAQDLRYIPSMSETSGIDSGYGFLSEYLGIHLKFDKKDEFNPIRLRLFIILVIF